MAEIWAFVFLEERKKVIAESKVKKQNENAESSKSLHRKER